MPRFELADDVHLRSLEPGDADELYRLVDANRDHLARWMPWAPGQTREGVVAFIDESIAQERESDGFQVALVAGSAIAGVLGLHRLDRDNRSTSLGYWLARSAQGRGLMTRAVARLIDHGFGELGLHRLQIRAAPDNPRSRAIPERLGFTEEGLLRGAERFGGQYRDLVLYSLLAPEWRGRDGAS
ncbi:MAG TPA: GNAT family protein [Solirubrobacterales bacterium]|nr:GNAT family protein [Solirubrobacterales bacterium]